MDVIIEVVECPNCNQTYPAPTDGKKVNHYLGCECGTILCYKPKKKTNG